MKKQLVSVVMVMSLAMITLNINTYAMETTNAVVVEEEDTSTFFIEGYIEDISYKEELIIKVGDTVTLDNLEVNNPSGVSVEAFEKTYNKIGTYKEVLKASDGTKYPFTVYVESNEAFKIVGAKNITVTEGEKFNILSGVCTTRKATLKVSKYDKTLVDVTQNVTITATSDDGKVVKKKIKLYIKNKPVKATKKYVYMRCEVNMHAKPSYETKNLGKIPYSKKVQVTGVVTVGKYKWYRVKYNGKVAYIFKNATSSKKLASIKAGIHVETKADGDLQYYQDYEDMRESGKIDHNGKLVIDRGWIKQD